MAQVLTRAQWGARPPTSSPEFVGLASRTGVAIHYDGEFPILLKNRDDVIEQIRGTQDFHMDTRGYADIGYNMLVVSAPGQPSIDGLVVEGRGRDIRGAHCEGHNTEWIGIQVTIGGDQRPSLAALSSARRLYDEYVLAAGHRLDKKRHLDGFGTDCPGEHLSDWVLDGMPTSPTAFAMIGDEFDMADINDLRKAIRDVVDTPAFKADVARFVLTGFAFAGADGAKRVLAGHITTLETNAQEQLARDAENLAQILGAGLTAGEIEAALKTVISSRADRAGRTSGNAVNPDPGSTPADPQPLPPPVERIPHD